VEHLRDGDLASRIGLAVQELLENSLKYSVDGASALTIDVTPSEGSGDAVAPATVLVGVRCRGQAAHLVELRRLLDEMGEADDRMAYYTAVMRSSAKKSSGSGLGLVRIWAEGEMTLTADIDGDSVYVRALANIGTTEYP